MARYKEILLDVNDRLTSVWTIDLVHPHPDITRIRAKLQEAQKIIEIYLNSWRDEETPAPKPPADHPKAKTVGRGRQKNLLAEDGTESSESAT